MRIPITRPFFDECEMENILKPLENGWVAQGPFVHEFENRFAKYIGARYARATSNCTTALHLALETLNIKAGNSVVIPSFTFVATANAVEMTGAEVQFCDIDLRTFSIDTDQLRKLLESDKNLKIKAVIPVNLFGLCADLYKIKKLAKLHNKFIVEDSACGFGALIKNRHSGTFGDLGCFSFHPRKAITTGEGGMVVTEKADLAQKIASLRNHGAEISDIQRHTSKNGFLLPVYDIRGYNCRMTDLQASIGICQIKKADYLLQKRRDVAARYDIALSGIDKLLLPYIPDGYISGYQSYVCLFTDGNPIESLNMRIIDKLNIKRNQIMMKLEEHGISVRQGTHAVHTLGYYKNKYNLSDERYLQSYAADRLTIALPLYATMREEEFNYVVDNLIEACS